MAAVSGNNLSAETLLKTLQSFVDGIASFESDNYSHKSARSEYNSSAISQHYKKEIEKIQKATEDSIKKIEDRKAFAAKANALSAKQEEEYVQEILKLREKEAEQVIQKREEEKKAQDKLNQALWKNYTIQEKLDYAKYKATELQKEVQFLEDKERAGLLNKEEENNLKILIQKRNDADSIYFNVRKAQIQALAEEERIQKYKTEVRKIEQEKKSQQELNKLENKNDKEKLRSQNSEINKLAKERIKNAADLYGISRIQQYNANDSRNQVLSTVSTVANVIGGGPKGISSALDDLLGKSSPVVSAIMSVLKVVNGINAAVGQGVQKAMSAQTSYMGQINARLQKSADDDTNYYQKMINWSNESAQMQDGLGLYIGSVNAIVDKSKYIDNLNNLVQSGIVRNAEERAMIQTLQSKMVTTFDAMDASLTRLVRLQQRDLTYTAMGQESLLTKFLGTQFQDTSYLNNMYDSVNSIILDATAKMTADQASAFSYEVQKWLGSLYSQGLSEQGVQELAKGITYLSTGDVTSLASSQSLQYIYASAAERAGLSYADILTRGLDTETTNELLGSVVEILKDIYQNSQTNVVQSAWSNITGLSISDLRSTINVSDDIITQIKSSHVTWADAIDETKNQLYQITQDYRTAAPELIENYINNALLSVGEKIVDTDNTYRGNILTSMLGLSGQSKYYSYYIGSQIGGVLGTLLQGSVTIPAIIDTVKNELDFKSGTKGASDLALVNMLKQVEDDLIINRGYAYRQERGFTHSSGTFPSQGLSHSQVDELLSGADVQSAYEASNYLSSLASSGAITASDYERYMGQYEQLTTTTSTPIVSLAQTAAQVESAARTIVNESEEDKALLTEATDISSYLFENENTIRVSLAKVEDNATTALIKALNIENDSELLQKISDKLHYKVDVDLIDNDVNTILNGIQSTKWSM